ncbi:LOW QUALITY PROTEIN: hypothetical protein BC936DRAFT_137271, partial [Jimgerdemannia flammicorona]
WLLRQQPCSPQHQGLYAADGSDRYGTILFSLVLAFYSPLNLLDTQVNSRRRAIRLAQGKVATPSGDESLMTRSARRSSITHAASSRWPTQVPTPMARSSSSRTRSILTWIPSTPSSASEYSIIFFIYSLPLDQHCIDINPYPVRQTTGSSTAPTRPWTRSRRYLLMSGTGRSRRFASGASRCTQIP